MGEGAGYNNPTFTIRFCNSAPSVLDDEAYQEDVTTGDSLNGACEALGKQEPAAPFSSRKHMHDRTPDTGSTDHTEQVLWDPVNLDFDANPYIWPEVRFFHRHMFFNLRQNTH